VTAGNGQRQASMAEEPPERAKGQKPGQPARHADGHAWAPGPLNAITDVLGIAVGHAEAPDLLTGTTVMLCDPPSAGAADIRGGAPATRASEGLMPGGAVQAVDAVVLSGGSAFGLDACGGAMDWLRCAGRGFQVGPQRVPIVAGAIIFDLLTGGPKTWETPPWWALGREAAAAARAAERFRLGNAGAGLGATAGSLKGGVGTASLRLGAVTVGALAVANPLGETVIPGSRSFWAWWLEQAGELGGQRPPTGPPTTFDHAFPAVAGANTTLAVVATDAKLSRDQAVRLAAMAHDGFARAIRPVHTPLDGDTVFALSTGRVALKDPLADLARIGMAAADCTARAIARGVYEAGSVAEIPAYRDLG